jgi:hypothetical protein
MLQDVDRRVKVIGFWDGQRKLGGCVTGALGKKPEVYLVARRNEGMTKINDLYRTADGTRLELIGVLRYHRELPTSRQYNADEAHAAIAPSHFYVDVEVTEVRVVAD